MQKLISFPPIAAPDARVLVLGSMPGRESLRLGQYYAFRQNAFWYVMDAFCGASFDLPYQERCGRLTRVGVALWDVLQFCEREGSLDADIKPDSEVPNDIGALLRAHPAIGTILFNGKKAEKAFRRHVLPGLPGDLRRRVRCVGMPSTSPAYASMRRQEKIRIWLAALSAALEAKHLP